MMKDACIGLDDRKPSRAAHSTEIGIELECRKQQFGQFLRRVCEDGEARALRLLGCHRFFDTREGQAFLRQVFAVVRDEIVDQ